MNQPGARDLLGVHPAAGDSVIVEILPASGAAIAGAVHQLTVKANITAPRVNQPAQGFQKRRLTMPIGPEDTDAFSCTDAQVDVAEDLHRIITAGEPGDLQHRLTHVLPPDRLQ